jgi:hypothetical protein
MGTRIKENRGMDQKIRALEAFRGKTVFTGGFGAVLEFLECFEGLGAKDRGSIEIWGFFRDFCGILDGLEWFRTYSSLFF